MEKPKEYIVVALTVSKLIEEGYSFKEIGINAIEVIDDEDCKRVYKGKEFKDWILETALEV